MQRVVRSATIVLLVVYAGVLLTSSVYVRSLLDHDTTDLPLGDYGAFYESGRAATVGLDPYDVYPLTPGAQLGQTNAAVNLNAPLSVLLFEPLALMEPSLGREVWFLATILAYVLIMAALWSMYPSWRGPMVIAWAAAMIGMWETIALGQIYALLGLVATGSWLLLGRQPLMAAILMGLLIAVKPNFVFWPLLLWLAGHRRVAVNACLAAFGFAAVPAAVLGPSIYLRWAEVARGTLVNAQVANASIGAVFVRAGLPQVAAISAMVLFLIVIAAIVAYLKPSAALTSSIALIALLLCSPLAWVGYSIFLMPVFASLPATLPVLTAAAILVVPRLPLEEASATSGLIRATFGSIYTLAWLLLLTQVLRRARGSRR